MLYYLCMCESEIIPTLAHIRAAEVGFVIALPDAGGQSEYVASPEEVALFLKDRDALYAKALGVTKQAYLAWVDDDFNIVCAATTRAGKPCPTIVKGGGGVSAKEWTERKGEYCEGHKGETYR